MDELLAMVEASAIRAPWGWALLATVVLALIKVWPLLQLQAFNARQALRAEKRSDRVSLLERIEALEGKLEIAVEHTHQMDMQLVSAMAAYRLIATELQRLDPDSVTLQQAQVLLTQSVQFAKDLPPDMAELYRKTGGLA